MPIQNTSLITGKKPEKVKIQEKSARRPITQWGKTILLEMTLHSNFNPHWVQHV